MTNFEFTVDTCMCIYRPQLPPKMAPIPHLSAYPPKLSCPQPLQIALAAKEPVKDKYQLGLD